VKHVAEFGPKKGTKPETGRRKKKITLITFWEGNREGGQNKLGGEDTMRRLHTKVRRRVLLSLQKTAIEGPTTPPRSQPPPKKKKKGLRKTEEGINIEQGGRGKKGLPRGEELVLSGTRSKKRGRIISKKGAPRSLHQRTPRKRHRGGREGGKNHGERGTPDSK